MMTPSASLNACNACEKNILSQHTTTAQFENTPPEHY